MIRFQCPECGFGDTEVGHLTRDSEIHCLVCLDEQGRLIRLECWEEEAEPVQARFRTLVAA